MSNVSPWLWGLALRLAYGILLICPAGGFALATLFIIAAPVWHPVFQPFHGFVNDQTWKSLSVRSCRQPILVGFARFTRKCTGLPLPRLALVSSTLGDLAHIAARIPRYRLPYRRKILSPQENSGRLCKLSSGSSRGDWHCVGTNGQR